MLGRRRGRIAATVVAALMAVALAHPVPGTGGQQVLAQASSLSVSSPVVARPAVVRLPVRMPTAAGPRGRLVVGDSLLVSVAARMRRAGFQVHAQVGRQFSTAPGIVRSYGSTLPRNLVIELGTNGTVRASDCRAVVRRAGTHRRVFLVTPRVPRSWQRTNLRTLRACDQRYRKSRVRIVDWYGYSSGHPRWFAADGIHLSATGRRRFAGLIDRALDRHALR